ncbi:MAG: NAD(P)H-hydrate dehydratase [bacterium]
MNIVNAKQMTNIDKRAELEFGIPSILFMENAGISIVKAINDFYPKSSSLAIFCGKGNNGGDGFVVARHLFNQEKKIIIYLLDCLDSLKGDAEINFKICQKMGIKINIIKNKKQLLKIKKTDLIIDAILGTGIKGEVQGFYKEVIEFINNLKIPIVSIDIPSGLNADTGLANFCIKANLTVTMQLPKFGLVLYPGAEYVGKLIVADISIPKKVIEKEKIKTKFITEVFIPQRKKDTHKGDYGKVFILAGSEGMSGAAFLSSMSCLYAGAGLVYLGIPKSLNNIMAKKLTEVIIYPLSETNQKTLSLKSKKEILEKIKNKDILCIGPGLSLNPETAKLIQEIIFEIDIPMILDADGLNAINDLSIFKKRKTPLVITPHLGEVSRLIKKDIEFIKENKISVALEISEKINGIVVLKGAHSIIATPQGNVYINSTGNPGMSSAGVGDILTGLIAGLMAQKISAENSAIIGTYIHGKCGDKASFEKGECSLIARNILEMIPYELKKIGG